MSTELTRVVLLSLVLGCVALAIGAPAAASEGQAVNASFATDSVVISDGAETATLHVGGAGDRVTIRSANVSADRLASMVDGTPTDDGGVRVSVPGDGDVPVRFPASLECRPGRYVFDVADGKATASILVMAPADADTGFTTGEQTVYAGERGEIGLVVERCAADRVSLVVGDENTSVRATVNVSKREAADVTGAIRFDPSNLTGPEAFTAANLTVTDAAVRRAPPNGTLAPGQYPLTLYDRDAVADVATLVVEPGEAPDSPSPTTASPSTDDRTAGPPASPAPGETTSVPTDSPAGTTGGTGVGFTTTATLLALLATILALARRP